MITWMQKHKKWLVITIWISTIAFVGAGFVGWGSYDYGKSSGAVAVVGERKISVEEYQREYSVLYEQYAKVFGEQFNQEMAKQLKLSDAALNLAIQKNLILSYGDTLGLDVTNEDIAKELVKIQAFIKNGRFDKELYLKILTQNSTNAKDFENSLKRNLQLQKIEKLFELNPNDNEVKNLNKLLFAEDDISIKILDVSKIDIVLDQSSMKKYWEENTFNYMSENSYELSIFTTPIKSISPSITDLERHYTKYKTDYKKADGKIKTFAEAQMDIVKDLSAKASKKDALKKHLALKKGELNFENTVVVYEDKLTYAAENIEKIKKTAVGSIIKPFQEGNDFVIIKIVNKFNPKTLSYEFAKSAVEKDFTKVTQEKELEKLAKKELENFNGKNIGYVNRGSITKIPGLNTTEATDFLNKLFASNTKLGQISLSNKVILYKINNSRMAGHDASKDSIVKTTLLELQTNELMNNLVKNLESKYEVSSSLNVKE